MARRLALALTPALTLALTLATVLATAPRVAAQDGVYGRLEGDLALEIGLGGGVTFEGERVSGAGTLEARARYLDVAGVALATEVRPEGASRFLVMVDVRPLWLARFLLGGSLGDRWVDLFLDSIGVDLGVAILPLDETAGAALVVGFGLGLPLVFFGDGIEGLTLRLYGRHVASLETDRYGPTAPQNDWIAGAALVVRFQAHSGLPSWGPPRYETREP